MHQLRTVTAIVVMVALLGGGSHEVWELGGNERNLVMEWLEINFRILTAGNDKEYDKE